MKTLLKGKNGFNPYTDLPTIVAVDFDGVLYDSNGKLVWSAIHTCRKLSKKGVQFIIWTCRPAESISDIVEDIISADVNIIGVNVNHIDLVNGYETESRKIFAHKYIDDQAIGWTKLSWNDIYSEINRYHKARIEKGELDMSGKPSKGMEKEVRETVKLLKDFGIEPTPEEIEEWKTWTSIKLENHVMVLLGRDPYIS